MHPRNRQIELTETISFVHSAVQAAAADQTDRGKNQTTPADHHKRDKKRDTEGKLEWTGAVRSRVYMNGAWTEEMDAGSRK